MITTMQSTRHTTHHLEENQLTRLGPRPSRFCPRLPRSRAVPRLRRSEVCVGAGPNDTISQPAGNNKRLFSSLSPKDFSHEPGSVWGATLLVAGTTVGAGILALPAVTQDAGFAASSATLTVCGAFAVLTGLMIAEVNLNVGAVAGASYVSVFSMASRTLGPAGGLMAAGLYIFHSYALLVAYVARGSQIASSASGLPQLPAALAFSLLFGGLCYGLTGPRLERINGALLGAGMVAFIGLLGVASSQMDVAVLGRADWSAVPPTVPIVALAFVFHNIIPVVVNNLEYDPVKVRSAIIAGVLIPFAMYEAWDGAILASLDNLATVAVAKAGAAPATALDAAAAAAGPETSAALDLARADPLELLQRSGGPVVAPLVEAFSFLAIATSYLGFVMALVDFLPDLFKPLAALPKEVRYALVVLPPVVFSTANPAVFFAALEFAGTYGVMTLYGMMPAAMSWADRYGSGTPDATTASSTTPVVASTPEQQIGAAAPSQSAASSTIRAAQEEGNAGVVITAVAAQQGTAAQGASEPSSTAGAPWPGLVARAQLFPGGRPVLIATGLAALAVVVSRSVA